jgi:uncharacterized protein RhaS with RHS repeats
MQARYYDPVIGRFYSNDPVGFSNVHNFNRYAYANNNPYRYVDPDGREGVDFRLNLRVGRLASGEITRGQYSSEIKAEAIGGAIGAALASMAIPYVAEFMTFGGLASGDPLAASGALSSLKYVSKISPQKQMRHIKGTAPANKSYFNSLDDAQDVLTNFNAGNYKLISENVKQSTVTIRVEGVFGRYVNAGNPNGLPDVNIETNVFMIQSLKSPKIVPVNPNKGL